MAQQAEVGSEAVPALGIIMFITRSPGGWATSANPSTFAFPVHYQIVEQATFDRVVRTERLSAGLVDGFVAARKLAAAGVAGLGIPDARVRHPDPAGVVASQPAPAGVFVDARAKVENRLASDHVAARDGARGAELRLGSGPCLPHAD